MGIAIRNFNRFALHLPSTSAKIFTNPRVRATYQLSQELAKENKIGKRKILALKVLFSMWTPYIWSTQLEINNCGLNKSDKMFVCISCYSLLIKGSSSPRLVVLITYHHQVVIYYR